LAFCLAVLGLDDGTPLAFCLAVLNVPKIRSLARLHSPRIRDEPTIGADCTPTATTIERALTTAWAEKKESHVILTDP